MTKPTPTQIEELNLLAQGSIGVLCPQRTAEAMARRGWVIIGDPQTDHYFVKITDAGRAALADVCLHPVVPGCREAASPRGTAKACERGERMKRLGLFFYYLYALLWPHQDVNIWSVGLAWRLAGIVTRDESRYDDRSP